MGWLDVFLLLQCIPLLNSLNWIKAFSLKRQNENTKMGCQETSKLKISIGWYGMSTGI